MGVQCRWRPLLWQPQENCRGLTDPLRQLLQKQRSHAGVGKDREVLPARPQHSTLGAQVGNPAALGCARAGSPGARRPPQPVEPAEWRGGRLSAARQAARGRHRSRSPDHPGHRGMGGPASAAAARQQADRPHLQEKQKVKVSSQKGAEKPRFEGWRPNPGLQCRDPAALDRPPGPAQLGPDQFDLPVEFLSRRCSWGGEDSSWRGLRARHQGCPRATQGPAGNSGPARRAWVARQDSGAVRREQRFDSCFRKERAEKPSVEATGARIPGSACADSRGPLGVERAGLPCASPPPQRGEISIGPGGTRGRAVRAARAPAWPTS